MLRLFKNCLVLALLSAAPLSFAATDLTLPGCEAPDSVQSQLDGVKLRSRFAGMTYHDRTARREEILSRLAIEYPREFAPRREWIYLVKYWDPSSLPTLQERFVKQANQSPNDALALTTAGYALIGTRDTEALQFLNQARSIAPTFPWPYLLRARIYSQGKIADEKQLKENVEAFFAICPTSSDTAAEQLLGQINDMDLEKRVATSMRAHLESATSPVELKTYKTLWILEFKTHSPTQFDKIRLQIATDLARIEARNSKPDASFQAFLIHGYEEIEAAQVAREKEDWLLHSYPESDEALSIKRRRWLANHRQPTDESDVAGWNAWERDYRQELRKWRTEFSENNNVTALIAVDAFQNDSGLSTAEISESAEYYLSMCEDQSHSIDCYLTPATFLLKHQVGLERAAQLLGSGQALFEQQQEYEQSNTDYSDHEAEKIRAYYESQRLKLAGAKLDAARQLGIPDVANQIRAYVEGPPPLEKASLSDYWTDRARLAEFDHRNADAMAFYQLANKTNLEPITWFHGEVRDDRALDVRRIWKEVGGTEEALGLWMKSMTSTGELGQEKWEKGDKPFITFALPDTSGKQWRLSDLHGKTALVSVWASWCSPCQAELPHLQKLYLSLKDRNDVEILTINIDDDVGLVNTFLRKNNYTFPVLLAYTSTSDYAKGGIPQNWIIGPDGVGVWKGSGFSGDSDWEENTIKKLESVKNSE